MSLKTGPYLREVLGLLYPHCPSGDPTTYLVIPDAHRSKLLVPTGSRRAAVAAVRRSPEPRGTLARLKRDATVLALRSGTWPAVLRDRVELKAADSIEAYLRGVLKTELSLSIHLGPARAARKPVLQLLSAAGDTLGFAKLGTGPLTRRLVRAETEALTGLSGLRLHKVTVPAVLHAGQWRGHEVLVQSPLPVWSARSPLTASRLTEAMLEVASACGIIRVWLATSPYWAQLRTRLARLADQDEGRALAEAARRLVERHADVGLRFGAWHGHWAPWNMANTDAGLLVWDWERFTAGVPLGFDALHHDLQRRLQSGVQPRVAAEETVRQAGGLLWPFDVAPGTADVTALLYLVDLAARHLADRQAEGGPRQGVLGTWMLPVVLDRVARL